MGGNAFKHLGPNVSFPRMHSSVYDARKDLLLLNLLSSYRIVAVPKEAHGKDNYGDIDFVVAFPRPGLTHEMVMHSLGAKHSVPIEGSKFTSFAIPDNGKGPEPVLSALSLSSETTPTDDRWDFDNTDDGESGGSNVESYYQVDVRVCAGLTEMENHMFYMSYGGLGSLLGLLFTKLGLSFGCKGLKVSFSASLVISTVLTRTLYQLRDSIATSPPISFYLTSSMMGALDVVDLSVEGWITGFSTQRELFDWILSSAPLRASATRILNGKTNPNEASKVLPLHRAFLAYVEQFNSTAPAPPLSNPNTDFKPVLPASYFGETCEAFTEYAVQYFGRTVELDTIYHIDRTRNHAKQVFTGKEVSKWTDIQGVPVRWIMDEVKRVLSLPSSGSDTSDGAHISAPEDATSTVVVPEDLNRVTLPSLEPWEIALYDMNQEQVRKIVLEAKDTLKNQGKLYFDWRAEKARKAAEKIQKEAAST